MKTSRPTKSGVILLTMASFAPIGARAQAYSGPKCLGPVCILAGYRAGDNQPRIGDKVIIYGPRELHAVDFGIRDGKVSYIWLKEGDFWLKDGE